MRVAMVSPFPPQRSGIADYSTVLAKSLSAHVELALFDFGNSRQLDRQLKVNGASSAAALVRALHGFDEVIYHIGNNPYYHREIMLCLGIQPGVAVVHDSVLYYLAAGMGAGGLAKALCAEEGLAGIAHASRIIGDSPERDPLRYPDAAEVPALRWFVQRAKAKAIIVHNHYSHARLKAAGYEGPITVIPLIAQGSANRFSVIERGTLRRSFGAAAGDIVVGSFGFLAPNKRMDKAMAALSRLKDRYPFRLLVIGEGGDLAADAARFGLSDRMTQLGFVSDEDFINYLQVVDVLVNLRFPTMGESSSSLSKALAIGIPALVSDAGSFSELPDDVVIKITTGDAEVDRLAEVFDNLFKSETLRSEIGERAAAYAQRVLTPAVVAAQYAAVLGCTGSADTEVRRAFSALD